MNKKGIIVIFYMVLMVFGAISLTSSIHYNKINDEDTPISSPDNKPESAAIPSKYSQYLNLSRSYIYNVSQFDSHFSWRNLTYGARGDAITNPGGQIKVNFTGFYNDPDVFGKSCFSNPIPYINITFIENQTGTGMLVTNTTFYNVSNSEAGLSLAIGYNAFHSGFLIQINNLNTLKLLAIEQISDSGYLPGSLKISDYDYLVAFEFKDDAELQNSTMIYDKTTGVLVYSKVENDYGPDLEIYLNDYNLNFQRTEDDDDDDDDDDDKKSQSIASFPLIIICIVLTLTSVAIILKTKNRFKKIY